MTFLFVDYENDTSLLSYCDGPDQFCTNLKLLRCNTDNGDY